MRMTECGSRTRVCRRGGSRVRTAPMRAVRMRGPADSSSSVQVSRAAHGKCCRGPVERRVVVPAATRVACAS
jgi:hypothetical protein